MGEYRALLRELVEPLAAVEGGAMASLVARALEGSDAELEMFLRSDDLWGGAGSIADQGFIEGPHEMRVGGIKAMVALGNLQVERGVTNVRTEMWVRTFEKWLRDGGGVRVVGRTPTCPQSRTGHGHGLGPPA